MPDKTSPDLSFRRARSGDLAALVALLADDVLGQSREIPGLPLLPAYADAFAAIDADPNQYLLVAEQGGAIVGCLQLSFIPGLSHRGAWRAQVESVRIAGHVRGQDLGGQLIRHALELARRRGCRLAQLTTDKSRADAQRFYRQLGFAASHEGMKLMLAQP